MKCRIFAQDCKSTLNYQRQMKLNVLSLIFMLAGAWLTVTAQDDVNMKFGKPTKEEMQMREYKADPSAEAVVLCRLTDVEYTVQATGYLADYHEKVRIKVLKPSGARFAKVVVPYQVAMSVNNNISGLKLNAKSLPQPGGSSNSYFEGEGVSGRFTTSMLGGKAQIKCLFNINKVAHSDKNYDTLRGMFDIFSKYCNEKLVFKKQ